VSLGELVALDPLEPPDRLVHQAAHLGEVAGDGQDLLAEAVLDGVPDLRGERRLELRRHLGERLDLQARPFERGLDVARLDASFGRPRDPLQCALDGVFVHARGM
jgi:hypothetical protein